jgi:tetratricopeptide (TPR) repeat protein
MPYKMVRELDTRRFSVFMLLTLFLAAFSNIAYGTSLMVETDKESYFSDEHITISGSGNPGESVSIIVEDDDTKIFESTAVVTQEGIFVMTFLLSGTQPGEYRVTAVIGLEEIIAEFRILDGESKLAHDLLELLSMSREKTLDMLELEEGSPVYVERYYEKFQIAEEIAEEAHAMFNEGEYQEAAHMVTEALRLYSESIKLAEDVEEKPEEEDFEEDVKRILELKDALERTYSYLEKVRMASAEFEEDGFDVSHVNSLIEEGLQLMQSVEEYLGEGKVDEAENLISETKNLLHKAMELIHEMNEFNKIEKARKFLTETEDRLDLMEERITNILGNIGVSEPILNEVSSVFENAKLGIEEVKILLETGEFKEAIDEFKEVFDDTEEGLDIVDEFDGTRREILGDVEELEAKIHYLAERIETLRDFSVDISGFISKIEHARALLEKAVQELEGGAVDVTEELVEGVEGLIRLIEDELEYQYKKIRAEAELDIKEENTLNATEPDEKELTVEAWDESGVNDEHMLELFMWIDKLEEELVRITGRIDELGETGYNVSGLMSRVDMAKHMIQSAVEHLDKGEWEPARMEISELVGLLEHIEFVLNSVHGDVSDVEANTVIDVKAGEECDEESVKRFSIELEELEREFARMWDLVESLGDKGASLEPHLHYGQELFAELMELQPCDDAAVIKTIQLWDLFEDIEVFSKAILENVEIVEEVPEVAVWYYVLEMSDEVYGKFEWMVVKVFEEDSRIVFEEGQVYDCFLEWILSVNDEVYEALHGRIISVNWSNEEVVEWYFEGAVPFSWSSSELDAFTGEPHPMERLELSVTFVEEA